MPRLQIIFCFALSALMLASPAHADHVLSVDLKAYKLVTKAKVTSLVPAEEVKPADVIEYRATYKNVSKRAIQGVMGVVPIPEGLTLQPKSPIPAGAEASLDGRQFSKIPLRRAEIQADGSSRVVEVPLSEYRAVRWGIGALAAGASKDVSVRAVVNSN